jgi:adenylosuccinate synthase
VYGVCKAYETYVGNKKFEGDDPLFPKIREVGQEFGATTGRPRQVGFLDLDNLIRSATINGATHLIVNKIDILEEIGVWKLLYENQVRDLETKVNFIRFITETMTKKVETIRNIYYSSSPEDI